MPRIEIISSGSELLRGRGIDLHLGWFGRELEKVGLEISHHQTVPDDRRLLVDALKLAMARSDVVLLTGGLGPTGDDHTREAAARAFHRPLVFQAAQWKKIRERFGHHRIRMAAINRRQAYAPKGARILPNPMGSAPGFLIRENGVLFAATPTLTRFKASSTVIGLLAAKAPLAATTKFKHNSDIKTRIPEIPLIDLVWLQQRRAY